MANYYDILDVKKDASKEQIKKAYEIIESMGHNMNNIKEEIELNKYINSQLSKKELYKKIESQIKLIKINF